jgi:hypothetical protein
MGVKKSRAVCLAFRSKHLSPHIYDCNMKVEVSTFVAAVRQYCKCGKFGHIKNFVRRKNNASHAEKQNLNHLLLKYAQTVMIITGQTVRDVQ